MADLGWPELSVIALAVVLLFGWKRLPDMARSLGRSARIFKTEVDQLRTPDPADPADPAKLADAAAEAERRAAAADVEVDRLRAELRDRQGRAGSH